MSFKQVTQMCLYGAIVLTEWGSMLCTCQRRPRTSQVRLVLEYCDRGCLRDALDEGGCANQ